MVDAVLPEKLKVNVVSEAVVQEDQGVHTVFVDCIGLLQKREDAEVFVNSDEPCHVAHFHSYGPYCLWKTRNYKGRRIFTAHVIPDSMEGSVPFVRLVKPVGKLWLKRVYNYATVVIAVGPVAKEAIEKLGVKTRVVVIPNPIRKERFYPSSELRVEGRKLLGIPQESFTVLCVGQVQPRKGIDSFVEVAKRLSHIQFVWVGGRPFGYFTAAYHRLSRLMKDPPENLKFGGTFKLDQMPAIYNAGDVFFFPSFQENCSLAILEAAACGLPLVLRQTKEYQALYSKPYLSGENEEDFVKLIQKLYEDEVFYQEWVRRSAELIEPFSAEAISDCLMSLYREVYEEYSHSQKQHQKLGNI